MVKSGTAEKQLLGFLIFVHFIVLIIITDVHCCTKLVCGVLLFEIQSHICSLGWPQTHDPPVSTPECRDYGVHL